MKRLLSMILSLCILLSSVHITSIKVNAASSLSDSQITAIVENYLSIVGSNRYWNANIRSNQDLLKTQANNGDYLSATTTTACPRVNGYHDSNHGCTSNKFTGVSRGTAQCWGFGDYIEYVIFKTTDGSSWTKHYNVDSNFQFRPGDLIWSQKGSSSQHIRVVYKVVDSKVYVIEGNGDGHCKIMTNILNDPHSYVNYSSSSYVMTPPSSLRNDDSEKDTEVPIAVNLGENFYAYIGHQSTGKWLSNTNGNIEGSAPTGNPNQIWNFIRQSDGSYIIKNMLDNSYMDVWGTSTETGTNLYCCSTYTGDVNQRFFIYYMYDAYYFRPVYTNMHLDMNSTTYNLELWGVGEDWSPQEFNIQIIDENGNLPQNLGENFYAYIGHQSTGKWLTNVSGNIEGSIPTGNSEQIWNFIRQFDGSYVIKNTYNNSYMDVWGTFTENGTNIYCCNKYTGDLNQRFFIYYMYDAYYIRPVYTRMRLDMSSTTYNLELWGIGEDWPPQEFNIQIIDENGNLPQNLGMDFYATIQNIYLDKYLTNNANNIEGQNINDDKSQLWHFVRCFDGSYTIKSMLNNSYMDVLGTSTEYGTNIYCCNKYTGDVNQRFFIYYMYDAYYIRPVYTRMRLDMSSTTYNLELWGIGEDWSPQEFNIKKKELYSMVEFKAEDSKNIPTPITKYYGEVAILSETIPTKEGYIFKNWNTEVNGTGKTYNPGDLYTANKSIILYAQWEKIAPYANSIVTKKGSSYYINVAPVNIDNPCEVIIAGYEDGKLVTLTSVPYELEEINTTLSGDIDEISVMVWNSLSGLQPLCAAEIIPSSEFITE